MNSVFGRTTFMLNRISMHFANVGFRQLFVPTGTLILANEKSDWFLSLLRHNGCNILFWKSRHHIPTDPYGYRRLTVRESISPPGGEKKKLDGVTYIRGRYTPNDASNDTEPHNAEENHSWRIDRSTIDCEINERELPSPPLFTLFFQLPFSNCVRLSIEHARWSIELCTLCFFLSDCCTCPGRSRRNWIVDCTRCFKQTT